MRLRAGRIQARRGKTTQDSPFAYANSLLGWMQDTEAKFPGTPEPEIENFKEWGGDRKTKKTESLQDVLKQLSR